VDDVMPGRPFSDLTTATARAELEEAGMPPFEARAQEFRAGGIGVSAVIELRPNGLPGGLVSGLPGPAAGDTVDDTAGEAGGDTAPLRWWPLLVVLLDEAMHRVAPELGRLLAAPEPLVDPDSGPALWGNWSILDGPHPLFKLTVHGRGPDGFDAELVLPAQPLADVLPALARAPGVGLMADDRGRALPTHGMLGDAFDQMLFVPTSPSPGLLMLARRYGVVDRWEDPRDPQLPPG
jgi:hypothetical protein